MEFSKEELDNEIWRDIPDYEGHYQVSNLGRVRSLNRYINHKDHKVQYVTGRLINYHKVRQYFQVRLSMNGTTKQYYIHRLVMLTFNGYSKLCVDHIDGNTENNRLSNLRYVTYKENSNNPITLRRLRSICSKYIIQYDLNDNIINEYNSITEAHNKTDVAKSQICWACKGKYETAGGYKWKYRN